jgi:hypothetical protein
MGAEVSTLTADRLDGRLGRIIPLLLDPHAPVPALLRSLDRRLVGDYEAIRDAILGWTDKPPLGTVPVRSRVSSMALRLTASEGQAFDASWSTGASSSLG